MTGMGSRDPGLCRTASDRLLRVLRVSTCLGVGVALVCVDTPHAQTPPGLQPDRPLAPAAAPGSAQAEEALRRHRELGMRIAGLLRDAEQLGRRSSTVLGELRRIEVERDLQQARAEQARASLAVIEADLAALEARVATLEAARARETPAVTARLQRLQRLGRVGYARVVWGTSSAQTLGRAARMMTHMAREDSARLLHYRELTTELSAADARLRGRRAEAVELRAASDQLLRAATSAAAERQRLLAQIGTERDQRMRVVEELERARAALDSAVAAYLPTGGGAGAVAPPPASPAALAPLTSRRRTLPWPVAGSVQQRFGRTRDPRFGTTVVRNGLDIGAEAGTVVRAIHGGTVAFAGQFEGFGRLIIVDHGRQAFSLYGYLSAIRVASGSPVSAGEAIGEVGEAPAGGPSLYFELRVDGRPVDPLQWLAGR